MKKTKLILATLTIMFVALLCSTVEAQAALQANSDTHANSNNQKTPTDWMSGFRQMEEKGGGMGLSENLNGDLTSTSSNSIDVHMMRATEYGAIAILSASGYGNPSNDKVITTTTGNKTGIYFSGSNWEFVAGGLENSIFSGKNKKYYDGKAKLDYVHFSQVADSDARVLALQSGEVDLANTIDYSSLKLFRNNKN